MCFFISSRFKSPCKSAGKKFEFWIIQLNKGLIYYEEKQAPNYSTVTRLITACCASGKFAVWAINIHFIHWWDGTGKKNYQTREAGKKVCVSASTHSKTQALQKFMWWRWGQSGQCTLASWRAWVQHQPDIQNTTSVTAVSQKGKAYSSLCVRKNI